MNGRLCQVVRGTTFNGQVLNEGDTVTLDESTFQKLSIYKDVVEKMPEAAPEPIQQQPKKKTA